MSSSCYIAALYFSDIWVMINTDTPVTIEIWSNRAINYWAASVAAEFWLCWPVWSSQAITCVVASRASKLLASWAADPCVCVLPACPELSSWSILQHWSTCQPVLWPKLSILHPAGQIKSLAATSVNCSSVLQLISCCWQCLVIKCG